MKIGMCTNFLASFPDATGLEWLDNVAAAGFDFVEVPAGSLLALSEDKLEHAVERIQAAGIPCPAFNSIFRPEIRLTGPAVDNALVNDYMDSVLALGRRLGVDTVVFGSGAARNIPFGYPAELAWDQLVEMLLRFAPKAAGAGVTVVVEHLNRMETNIVDSFAEAVRLVKDVNHPSVRCLVDFFHLDVGRETTEAVAEDFELVSHVHCTNALGRGIPAADMHDRRLAEFLAFLREKGYAGRVSVEGVALGRDMDDCLVGAVEFMREYVEA